MEYNIFLLQIESTIFLILFAFGKVSEKVDWAESSVVRWNENISQSASMMLLLGSAESSDFAFGHTKWNYQKKMLKK